MVKPFNMNSMNAQIRSSHESRQRMPELYANKISPVNRISPNGGFLEKVMSFIEANLTAPTLNVEDLGKEVFMSRVTLYRKIKALTNQTAIEYIRFVRIRKAAQLLITNQYRVNEVAYMVGYNDVDYFRKCFKEEFNATPKEFLKQACKAPHSV
jgi:AraC-like DNA-binding protein